MNASRARTPLNAARLLPAVVLTLGVAASALHAGEFFPNDSAGNGRRKGSWNVTRTSSEQPMLLPPAESAAPARSPVPTPVRTSFSQPAPNGAKQIYDSEFRPKPIGEVTTDLAEPDFRADPKGKPKPKLQSTPAPERGAYATNTFASAEPMLLNRPDGGWFENAFSGPVAPFCHLPLYFEDASLERFGESRGLLCQSLRSTGDFALRVPLLPYLMTVDPPCREVPPNYCQPPYSLSAKVEHYARGIDPKAVAVQAAAVALVILVVP